MHLTCRIFKAAFFQGGLECSRGSYSAISRATGCQAINTSNEDGARLASHATRTDPGPWAPGLLWPNFFETAASASGSKYAQAVLAFGKRSLGIRRTFQGDHSQPASSFSGPMPHNLCPLCSSTQSAVRGGRGGHRSIPRRASLLVLQAGNGAPEQEGTLPRSQGELRPAPGSQAPGWGPLHSATTTAMSVLSFLPQTFAAYLCTLSAEPGAGVQWHRLSLRPHSLPSRAWMGWSAVVPAPGRPSDLGRAVFHVGRPRVWSRARPWKQAKEDIPKEITRCSHPTSLFKQMRRLKVRVGVTSSRPRSYRGGAATPNRSRHLCL